MPQITLESKEDFTFECSEGDTILRAALRAGIGFPYACNTGSCGNCRFTLIEGAVEHAREDAPAWTKRDLQRNRFLGCQAKALRDCRIKLRLDSAYTPRHIPNRVNATLTSRTPITHDIAEFAFELEAPKQFLPGQYALLEIPGIDGARAYSMSNVFDGGAEWQFFVKRVPEGEATTALFDRLDIGDSVVIDGPYGTAFLREESPRDIVCLAGGSGLSPVISIARAVAASDKLAGRRIDFVYGGRTTRDICGHEILAGLPGFGTLIHFHGAISDPDADGGNWAGPVGFVHEIARDLLADRLPEREIYFAGPPAMGAATQKMLFDLKVPLDQVHFDEFY